MQISAKQCLEILCEHDIIPKRAVQNDTDTDSCEACLREAPALHLLY